MLGNQSSAEVRQFLQRANIFHWRSRDGEEVDFLLEFDPSRRLFIEAKVTPKSNIDIS